MDETPRRTRSGSQTRQRNLRPSMACTPGEFAQLSVAAERVGLSVSSFMRMQCLGVKPPRASRRPTVETALLAQALALLGRASGGQGKSGSNVNQIAHQLNAGSDPQPYLRDAIEEVRASTREIREAAHMIMRALGKRDV